PPPGVPAAALPRRRELLRALAAQEKVQGGPAGEMQRRYEDAFRLLASDSVHKALDLSQEPQRVRERYGFGPASVSVGEGGVGGNGAELAEARPMRGQNLLLARRLVEAGVPFVNVYDFRQQGRNWDAHFKVFNQHKTHLLPLMDQSLSA